MGYTVNSLHEQGKHMKLILTDAELKRTTSNDLDYIVLSFFYPAKNKSVQYSVWSFIHTEANGLAKVWTNATRAEVGGVYNVHFEKRQVNGLTQFVVTMLDRVLE